MIPALARLHSGVPVPDTLDVTRRNELPLNPPRPFSAPLHRVVADSTKVRRLYAAVRRQKPVEPGTHVFCPASLGVDYRLVFLRGDREVLQVNVEASGCQFLTEERPIARGAYWTDRSFWRALGAALDIEPDLLHVPDAKPWRHT